MKRLLTFLSTTLLLVGCTGNGNVSKKGFENVFFDSASYVYDGNSHILNEVRGAPSDTSITYVGREAHTDSGTYEASALLVKDGYNDKTLTATLTITNASFANIGFANQTVEYDGQEHSITVTNLPSFATVTYENNKGAEIGTYNATARITATNYNELVLHATLTITAPLLDFEDAEMEDLTVDYDGKSHTIEPQGYPAGTKVTYKGSYTFIDAGTYTISCTLSKEGFHDKDLSATLTINKISFDDLVFEDSYVLYDGKAHSITVKNAPSGSTISYRCLSGSGTNSFVNKGTYEVQATISHKNYNQVILTATLRIMDVRDAIGVDDSKEAYQFEETPMWDDAFGAVLNNNYSLIIYSGTHEKDEEVAFSSNESYSEIVADGNKAVVHYHSVTYSYDEYTFYNTVGDDTVIYCFRVGEEEEGYFTKFPAAALDETVIKYYPAAAFNGLQEASDGTLISGVDLDDFYGDVGSYEVKNNRLCIILQHLRDGAYPYTMYEFFNVGNSKIVLPDFLSPSEEEIENINMTGKDFIIDGIEYGTHLVSTWNSPQEYMAHTYLYYWQQLILEPGVHFVAPSIYGKVVQRVAYAYYSEVNIYNYNMTGYEVNVWFDKDGNYQGEYEEYGTVTDRTSEFVRRGGAVHYYDEWHN